MCKFRLAHQCANGPKNCSFRTATRDLVTGLPGYLLQARRRMGSRGRSPAYLASIRAKRAPFTSAREGRLKSAIRWAFWISRGEPLTTGQLLVKCYIWEWLTEKRFKPWHRTNVHRAADRLAVRIGRASSQGRPILWAPRPGLLEHYVWRPSVPRALYRKT
jgi:hypothetical protein